MFQPAERVKEYLSKFHTVQYLRGFAFRNRYLKFKGKKKIFFLMIPRSGNLGDQAIALATSRFLEEEFSDYEIILIYSIQVYRHMVSIRAALEPGDLVVLQGGGNLGNLYPDLEKLRRFIVRKLRGKGVKIISMPNTVSFTDNREGQRMRMKSRKVYESNPNLILMARDKISYGMLQEFFPGCKSLLCPDMAFYLWNPRPQTERKGIALCLRTDIESTLKQKRGELIRELWKTAPDQDVAILDTYVSRPVQHEMRPFEVQSLLNILSRYEVVVTDRLHGLILSVITNTPCVVLPSLDHKIRGIFSWVEELDFISFLEDPDIDRIKAEITRLKTVDSTQFIDFKALYFNHLRQRIEELR